MTIGGLFVAILVTYVGAFLHGRKSAPKPAPAPKEPRLFGLTDARALRSTLSGNAGVVKNLLAYLNFSLTVADDAARALAMNEQSIGNNTKGIAASEAQIANLQKVIESYKASNAAMLDGIADDRALAALFAEGNN